MNLEEQLGIKLSVVIAGLIGGIVSLTYHTKVSFLKALALIAAGASTAAYLHPIVAHYLSTDDRFSSGIGFLLGLTSMKLIGGIMTSADKVVNILVSRVPTLAAILGLTKDTTDDTGSTKRNSSSD